MKNSKAIPPPLVPHTLKVIMPVFTPSMYAGTGTGEQALHWGQVRPAGGDGRQTDAAARPFGRGNDGHTPPPRRKHFFICITTQCLGNEQMTLLGQVNFIKYLSICLSCDIAAAYGKAFLMEKSYSITHNFIFIYCYSVSRYSMYN